MAYNRKYHLQRVLKFQEFVQEIQNEHKGLPLTKVYSSYVRNEFDISYSTFTKWLGINAKRELKELEEKELLTVINQ
jgi:hypothetical protein